jgi:hypothetical protein
MYGTRAPNLRSTKMSSHPDEKFKNDLAALLTRRQRYLDGPGHQPLRDARRLWTSENILFFIRELTYLLHILSDAEGKAISLKLSDAAIAHRPDDIEWIRVRVSMTLQSDPIEALTFALRALSLENSHQSLYHVAEAHRRLGNFAEASYHARRALELLRAEGGPPDPEYEEILEDLIGDDELPS